MRSCCVLLMLVTVLGLGLFVTGYLMPAQWSILHSWTLRGKISEQSARLAQQQAQLVQSDNQITMITRSLHVQEAANQALTRRLNRADVDLNEARERLVLYEEILAPQTGASGLQIRHFAIKQRVIDAEGKVIEHDRRYHYHLVLGYGRLASETIISGKMDLAFNGQQDQQARRLSLADNVFSLKYYQSLEGEFELPLGFTPTTVNVTLSPETGSAAERINQRYDWASFELSKNLRDIKE